MAYLIRKTRTPNPQLLENLNKQKTTRSHLHFACLQQHPHLINPPPTHTHKTNSTEHEN